MKCIFPILPLLILAGMGNLARAQVGFIQRADNPAGRAAPPAAGSAPPAASPGNRAAAAPAAARQAPAFQQGQPFPSRPTGQGGPAGTSPLPAARTATLPASNPPPVASLPAAPAPAAKPTATAADRAAEALRRAVSIQSEWRSVAARVRTEVHLLDQHLVGSGIYIQGPVRQGGWRLELRIQTESGACSLLQACDGKQFWTYRQLSDRRALEWIDAARVANLLARHGPGSPPSPGQAGMVPSTSLGVGGLPCLLRTLGECFEFRAVNEGQLERMPVWILQGSWRPATLAVLLPEQREAIEAGQPADLSRLAAHIPDRVTLFLGRDDLFPYRLEYHRDHPGEKEWEAAARRKPPAAVVTLEWFEVRFNVPLTEDQFFYDPGETKFEDVTGRYLEGLGLPLN